MNELPRSIESHFLNTGNTNVRIVGGGDPNRVVVRKYGITNNNTKSKLNFY